MYKKPVGYVVEIDWSQTDKDYVFVEGAKSRKEAVDYIIDRGCNCPRINAVRTIDRAYKIGA